MHKLAIAAACAALISGCANSPIFADERERRQCLEYGLAEGTPEHASCRIQLSSARMQRSQALGSLGAAILVNQPAQPVRPSPFSSYQIDGRTYYCSTLGTSTTCH